MPPSQQTISIFLRSDAVATIFSLFVLVRLLFEGGYYSRAAFIWLGRYR